MEHRGWLDKHFWNTQHVLKTWERREARVRGVCMKELSDWSLWVCEGCEECWVEMDQGPSESGLHPNTDLPFGEHSSRAHIWDRKDTNWLPRRQVALALPHLLLRPWTLILMPHTH